MKTYLTSESVCKGHPDKLCDFIADSILDACLAVDPLSRVACEVLATKGKIVVAGEITCSYKINIRDIVRCALTDCGYNPSNFSISVFIHAQSSDIAFGVNTALEVRNNKDEQETELGAGDQGTVVGFATDETSTYLPLPLELSHRICKTLDEKRKTKEIAGIKSDGKAQVTIEYRNKVPYKVKAIIVSIQHDQYKDLKELKSETISKVLEPAFSDFPFDEQTQILINPSGRFVKGGPEADTGVTGRKLMVDSYGGLALHGGGAFSGKDATKVDRCAAYMARLIAKTIVVSKLAKRCEVSISYAIGKANPVALNINTFGTSNYSEKQLIEATLKTFSLKPKDIIDTLKLKEPIFSFTSCYGHFGNPLFPWEQVLDTYTSKLKGELAYGN